MQERLPETFFSGKDKRVIPDPTRNGKPHDNPHHPSQHGNEKREQGLPKPTSKSIPK